MSDTSSENMPGQNLHSSPVIRPLRIAKWVSLLIAFVLSFFNLVGWAFNITIFQNLVPQWIPMKIIAAICFIITTTALVLIQAELPPVIRKTIPRILASLICLISLLSLFFSIYTFKSDQESSFTGISFFSFFFSSEMRMTFLTSFNFLLIGITFFLITSKDPNKSGIAHILIIPVVSVCYIVIVSYILYIHSLIQLSEITMGLDSSIAFGCISAAVLIIRPDTWLVRVFIPSSTSGIITKKFLPAVIILPVIIGWLRIQSERSGIFSSEVGVVVVAITYTVGLLLFMWWTIRSINLVEKRRQASEEALQKSEIRLKELIATKDKFFSIVAHDLKNPFTSLLGSSELLSQNIDQMNVEDIKTLTMILNDSAKNGYAILQNLLDWSRSQTGMLEINAERIDLKNLVDRNFSNLQLSANNKEIKIYLESLDDIYIFTDKNMISTVLRNLLSNAIKFTRRGGKVMVGAQVDSDEVIISVKDNGIGIPENKIEMLFRIDKRNSTPGTENEQGTGLGLKLSKEFIEKLGGRLWVESIENKGSTFKFSVPIKEG
jgi:signal transduction histidine kinase